MEENLQVYNLHTQLLNVVLNSKRSFVVMGKLLSQLKQDDNFRTVVGEGIDTWNDYIGQPEIGLSRGEADRLIQIYEQFVLRFGVDEEFLSTVSIKNLHYLLPVVKDMEEDADEEVAGLVNEASHLSQSDFKDRIHELKSPDSTKTYEFLVMRKCIETGRMNKIHGIDSEFIRQTFNLQDAE